VATQSPKTSGANILRAVCWGGTKMLNCYFKWVLGGGGGGARYRLVHVGYCGVVNIGLAEDLDLWL